MKATVKIAINMWPVLLQAASEHRTYTYKEVADAIGLETVHLSRQLDVISKWCRQQGHPPLTMLVVSSDTYLPLGEFGEASDLQSYVTAQQRVFEKKWARHTSEFFGFALEHLRGD